MKNNFLRSAATHGLIIGLALFVLSLLDWALGFYGQQTWFYFLSYVVIFVGLLLCAKAYRDKEMGGYISYGHAFGYSVVTAVFFSFVSIVFTLLLTQVIDPTYMDKVLEMSEQKLLESGFSEAQIDAAMEMSRKISHPAIALVTGIFGTAFMSTLISLITSIFVMRRNPNPFSQQEQF